MDAQPRTDRVARLAALLTCVIGLGASPARAGVVDEVWLGAFAHDTAHIGDGKESGTANIQLEIDSVPPALLRPIGAPRVNATVSVNTAGLTDFASLGLTWRLKLVGPLQATGDAGLAVTDGVTNPPPGPAGAYDHAHRLLLGSRVLFRVAGGLGWRLSPRWTIGAEYVHLSNGHVFAQRHNQGINAAGLRIGYRFQ